MRAELLKRPRAPSESTTTTSKPLSHAKGFVVGHPGTVRSLMQLHPSVALRDGSEFGRDRVVEAERREAHKAKFLGDPVLHPTSHVDAKKSVQVGYTLTSLDDDALAAEMAAMHARKQFANSQRMGTSVRFSATQKSAAATAASSPA